jgi:hypothetical protein
LFIIVRILEGKADLKAKKMGYTKELVKALYNLESFYASGREIGLNTMLLCDEKITKDNQLLDYKETAEYLHSSMIKPKRGSLISNLINSHPPTYHRIAALLTNKLKPGKEALLPFICLKKTSQKKYAILFKDARIEFKKIANEKFQEFFGVKDISMMMEDFGRKEIYKYELNKEFIFINKTTDNLIIGRLERIDFKNDICDTDQFTILNIKNRSVNKIDASLFKKTPINLNGKYFLEKDTPLILTDIKLDDTSTSGQYIFIDKNNKTLSMQIKKTKLSIPADFIKDFIDHEIFLKEKGSLRILKCTNVKIAENLDESEILLVDPNEHTNSIKFKFKDIIIRPRKIYLPISRNQLFRGSELNLINWLSHNQIRTYIYLKKPVNNFEIGYIQEIKSESKSSQISDEFSLKVENIFGKKVTIPYKSLESLSFDYFTGTIQRKSETSIVSKLGYKILKKFKPDRILYLNKI